MGKGGKMPLLALINFVSRYPHGLPNHNDLLPYCFDFILKLQPSNRGFQQVQVVPNGRLVSCFYPGSRIHQTTRRTEMFTGIFGLVIFIFDIVAIVSIIKSQAVNNAKILWTLLVVLLPLLGLVIWYVAGPKSSLARA
jgi:hypothetical protein